MTRAKGCIAVVAVGLLAIAHAQSKAPQSWSSVEVARNETPQVRVTDWPGRAIGAILGATLLVAPTAWILARNAQNWHLPDGAAGGAIIGAVMGTATSLGGLTGMGLVISSEEEVQRDSFQLPDLGVLVQQRLAERLPSVLDSGSSATVVVRPFPVRRDPWARLPMTTVVFRCEAFALDGRKGLVCNTVISVLAKSGARVVSRPYHYVGAYAGKPPSVREYRAERFKRLRGEIPTIAGSIVEDFLGYLQPE